MGEPKIQIGDHVLTEGQAMAVRVAVTTFHMDVSEDEARRDIGPIADAYRARLAEVIRIMLREAPQS